MIMWRFIWSLLLLMAGTTAMSASSTDCQDRLAPESLHYKVMYKWGLINKQAGSATLTLTHAPDGYHSILAASSAPWADRIFRVRDTLISKMMYDGMRPVLYEKIANEASEHKHDRVVYHYTGPSSVKADCYRKESTKGVLKVDEHRVLQADSLAVDMLSSFYVMRTLPYASWLPGHEYVVPIFSGKLKETLTIRYHGVDNVKVGDKDFPAYHITFIFTSKGGRKSSDDMDAWIWTDDRRVPLRLEGKLPVGKVHCIYDGNLETL